MEVFYRYFAMQWKYRRVTAEDIKTCSPKYLTQDEVDLILASPQNPVVEVLSGEIVG
jgi:hypothetical protein